MGKMLTFSMVCLALLKFAAAEFELTLTRYKDTTSLSTGPNRFSIAALEYLESHQWQSVEISDDLASYYHSNRDSTTVAIDELSEDDREWFQRAYNRAYGDDIFLPGQNAYQPQIYKFKNGLLESSRGGSESFVHYEIDGYSVFMLDESSFLIKMSNLADDYDYIWIEEWYVGIVKRNGKILLFPEQYLTDDLRMYITNLKETIGHRAQADRKLIRAFNYESIMFMYSVREDIRGLLFAINASPHIEDTDLVLELDEFLALQSTSLHAKR